MRKTMKMRTKVLAGLGLMAAMMVMPMGLVTAQAAENVAIDEANFPDEEFRYDLREDFDENNDGLLDESEIAGVTAMYVVGHDIESLEGVQYFRNLEKLHCLGNKLTKLDVSKNTKLKELNCSDNKLTKLDVSKNTKLTTLDCSGNKLTKLDVSKNTKLTALDCSGNKLTKLDVSKNTKLKELDCSDNKLTKLNVNKNKKLWNLYCNENKLKKLDVSKNTKLIRLWCWGNKLKKLDVSTNVELEDCKCDDKVTVTRFCP